jgi:hypothetical protein
MPAAVVAEACEGFGAACCGAVAAMLRLLRSWCGLSVAGLLREGHLSPHIEVRDDIAVDADPAGHF